MPSRVKLKLAFAESQRQLREAQIARQVAERIASDMQKSYTALRTQFEALSKEYSKLGEMWNAFQGCVYRPTEKDMIRKRAQGEMVQAIAQKLVELFMPKDMR